MHAAGHSWELRFDRILTWLRWTTLALGLVVSFVELRAAPAALGAAAAAAIYVVAGQALPVRLLSRPLLAEAMAVGGLGLTMTAVGITGGTGSPYLLLSIVPVLSAAMFSGWRLAIELAGLAGLALAGIAVGVQHAFDLGELVGLGSFYLVIAITSSYARQLLVEEGARSRAVQQASQEAEARLERLDTAHRLLGRLAEMTEAADLNPVSAGTAALESLAGVVPYQAGMVALAGEDGPVVVARHRTAEASAQNRVFVPLEVGAEEVGLVVLARDEPFLGADREVIQESLRPVSLAFANLLLLQQIARRAIREERHRLARELHDEIGPSLASLGLGLDLALLPQATGPGLSRHLAELRGSVSRLVEEVRDTVSDLRADRGTLPERLAELAEAVSGPAPKVILGLTQEGAPEQGIMNQAAAVVVEAFRNALRHSQAAVVRVDGRVDGDHISVSVQDDGRGFHPDLTDPGHFGVLGMRERAELIGAKLRISSWPGMGTSVELDWP